MRTCRLRSPVPAGTGPDRDRGARARVCKTDHTYQAAVAERVGLAGASPCVALRGEQSDQGALPPTRSSETFISHCRHRWLCFCPDPSGMILKFNSNAEKCGSKF